MLTLTDTDLHAQHKSEMDRWQRVWLNAIKAHGKWVRRSAEEINRAVNELRIIPEFETQAEDELRQADLALAEASLAVKLARREFERARGVAHVEAAE